MTERMVVSYGRKVWVDDMGVEHNTYHSYVGLEDDVPEGTSRDSFQAGLRSWCIAKINDDIEVMRDIEDGHAALDKFESASETFAEEVGATVAGKPSEFVEGYDPGASDVAVPPPNVRRAEEKPPLPSDSLQEASGSPSSDSAGQKAVHAADTDYRKTFRVQSFEVAKTSTGDKYLRCYGKAPWKREWVPAWSDVAELLFGEIEDMDLGVIGPPYDLDAVVQMKDDEWKGKKYIAPDKIIEWERVE